MRTRRGFAPKSRYTWSKRSICRTQTVHFAVLGAAYANNRWFNNVTAIGPHVIAPAPVNCDVARHRSHEMKHRARAHACQIFLEIFGEQTPMSFGNWIHDGVEPNFARTINWKWAVSFASSDNLFPHNIGSGPRWKVSTEFEIYKCYLFSFVLTKCYLSIIDL